MCATDMPDELWRTILEMGVKTSSLSYKDLCCISISCSRLCRLSEEDTLWHHLLSSDFPRYNASTSSSSSSSSPPSFLFSSSSAKCLYRTRFEKEKERKVAAHRRALLRKESEIAELYRSIRDIDVRLSEETERLHTAMAEYSNLKRVRQATLALNIWQPEIVRSRHRQIVEQNVVPVEGRCHVLEMEMRLCKQQIMSLDRSLRKAKLRRDSAKEELESMKYHPLRYYKSMLGGNQDRNVKRKKLKTCIDS